MSRRILGVFVLPVAFGLGALSSCGTDDAPGASETLDASVPADAAARDGAPEDAASMADARDAAPEASYAEYGNGPRRDLVYVDPSFTKAAARGLHRDPAFDTALDGEIYAQPIPVANGPGGKDALVVVTERNMVYALDAKTGAKLWVRSMGAPAARAGPPSCFSIQPLGITGTPIVDRTNRVVYVDSAIGTGVGDDTVKTHLVHALSLDDGAEMSGGWPVDVGAIVASNGTRFNANDQNQRGALTVLDGVLYVPFGAHTGDCGAYHGWVIGIPLGDPRSARGFATDDTHSGIWSPRGVSHDGKDLFVATGNGSAGAAWQHSNAILRLGKGPTFSGATKDFFTPSNRRALDDTDYGDMGGAGAIVIDVKGATPSALVLAHGKHGVAYVLDRQNLGGFGTGDGSVGEGLASDMLAAGAIIGASTAYATPAGTFVAFNELGYGVKCPGGPGQFDLVAYRVTATAPPKIETAWCGTNQGVGGPIVTMSSPGQNAVVWSVGTEATNRLHAWDGETGEILFDGGGPEEQMPRVLRFSIPTVAKGRMYVASQFAIHAFVP